MGKSRKKYYTVVIGRTPGIYYSWYGKGGAEEQVRSFPGARYKGFTTLKEAKEYLAYSQGASDSIGNRGVQTKKEMPYTAEKDEQLVDNGEVILFTDGGCINNPGPGGYGVVLLQGEKRQEIHGGYRLTTNNRMELMACIVGLKSLGEGFSRPVKVFTDSRYVVNGITKGWAKKWQQNNWMRDKSHSAENIDLWSELLDLAELIDVSFVWVKGHAGNRENERCDELAKLSAQQQGLPADHAYEKGQTRKTLPTLF